LPRSNDIPTDIVSIPLECLFRQETIRQIGRDKCGLIATFETSLLEKFTPYWADFTPYVRRLISTCFPSLPPFSNSLTHDNLLEILKEAYENIREPPGPLGQANPIGGRDDEQRAIAASDKAIFAFSIILARARARDNLLIFLFFLFSIFISCFILSFTAFREGLSARSSPLSIPSMSTDYAAITGCGVVRWT
jgi:hypothetical protein